MMLRVEIGPEDLKELCINFPTSLANRGQLWQVLDSMLCQEGVCRVCRAHTPGDYKSVERTAHLKRQADQRASFRLRRPARLSRPGGVQRQEASPAATCGYEIAATAVEGA